MIFVIHVYLNMFHLLLYLDKEYLILF